MRTMITQWIDLLRNEFSQLSINEVRKEISIGLTVSTVALPLSLAYALSIGVNPAVGLVTAILGGIIVGILGGTSFQISGATAAMAAILLPVVAQNGVETMFIGGLLAGVLLILVGFLGIGSIANYFPLPVVAGFASGISVLIILSQVDGVLGLKNGTGGSILNKLTNYLSVRAADIGWSELSVAIITVVVAMLIKKYDFGLSSLNFLLGIFVSAVAAIVLLWDVAKIGEIPNTILLDDRLTGLSMDGNIMPYISTAFSILFLVMIESLLANASGERITKKTPNNNIEMFALGVSNIIVPLFGGMPVSAAISRSNISIAAGGKTRLVPIFQGLFLLLMVFLLSRIISQIPLAALGGVLILTAWQMNDWDSIGSYLREKDFVAFSVFFITFLTIVFVNLIIGVFLGCMLQVTHYLIVSGKKKFHLDAKPISDNQWQLDGHLFFGTARAFQNEFENATTVNENITINMENVTHLDATGADIIKMIAESQRKNGGDLIIKGNSHLSDVIRKR